MTISEESLRIIESNLAIEHADRATLLGNEFTSTTYLYAGKEICRIPVSTCALYPSPEEKDYEYCRRNYLWFGSGGCVHKGLDLVLEAFVGMPNYHLTVCGPICDEKVFESIYYKELYQTPNIQTVGWVSVENDRFKEIIKNCIGFVYPSCSEGQSGAVVNCLHGGLIPIVSHESGVDVHDNGVILEDSSVHSIRGAVQTISSLPAERLQQMAYASWESAGSNHTREKFSEAFRAAILNERRT